MNDNQKKFNLYVFLSTFSRNLIEIFIPIILYKNGFDLKSVIFYFFIVNLNSAIITYPCVKFSNKYGYRILSVIGIIFFVITQLILSNVRINSLYLVILALMYSIYRRCYWIARKYFSLKVVRKTNISKTYSIMSIFNQVGEIFAAYIGALILDFVDSNVLIIISILFFLSSLIPLKKLEVKKNKKTKIELFKTIKNTPFQDLYLFMSYELLNLTKFLFPLYLFIYVKSNYSIVGILSVICNIATMIFSYIYGKKINKSKNYLKQSILLLTLIYILKANITSFLLIWICFFEGIFSKMNEISINKEFYKLSKKFEYENYNLMYNILETSFRAVVTLILLLFIKDIKIMIYISLAIFSLGSLISIKPIRKKDYNK